MYYVLKRPLKSEYCPRNARYAQEIGPRGVHYYSHTLDGAHRFISSEAAALTVYRENQKRLSTPLTIYRIEEQIEEIEVVETVEVINLVEVEI